MGAIATEYRWSDASAHVEGKDDVLVKVQPLLERLADWLPVIGEGLSDEDAALLRGPVCVRRAQAVR